MKNLEEIFFTFSFVKGDEYKLATLLTNLKPLLENKKDMTRYSLFDKYYKEVRMNIDYAAIVSLFEDLLKNEPTRKTRQRYLYAHWLYYQAFNTDQSLDPLETMKFIKELLQKKDQPENIIQNIAKKFNLQLFFKKSIQESQTYKSFEKYFTPSGMNLQKIKEKHIQLISILVQMASLGGQQSVQFEIQKHVLVSFERAYAQLSQEGSRLSDKLIQMKQIQKILSSQSRMNENLKIKFQELTFAKNEKAIYNILEGIKSDLTILDVYLLKYLITQAKKNTQQENGQQSWKNITLLVGPSGSGKSTIMLRVLGYQLEQSYIQDLKTLQPIDLQPEHSSLRTSPQSTSTTRYMFSAKIPKDSFAAGSYQDLEICDSPGFQDSAGCEVDISNSISIQTFLKNCASVKLVVVISQKKVGDKMEGIKQIAKIVSNLIVKYSEIQKDVLIVFNRFQNQQEFNRIKPGVQSILNSLTAAEKTNTQYVAFLKSLDKRLKPKKPDVIRFDPYETDIPDFVEQMIEGRIMNPREVFRYSLSSKSNQYISNRKAVLIKLIKDSLGKDNRLTLYYLNQLVLLSECVNNSDIIVEIQGIKDYIKIQASEKVKEFEEKIQGYIVYDYSNSNTFIELNKIKEQVESYLIFANIIKQIPTTRDIESKIKEVKHKILEEAGKLQFSEKVIEQTKKKVVSNIRFFGIIALHLQKEVLQKLSDLYYKRKKQFEQSLKNKEYTKLRDITTTLKNIYEVIQKGRDAVMTVNFSNPEKMIILDKKEFEDIIQRIKQQFERLSQSSTKFIEVFKMNPSSFQIKKETINNVNNNIKIFQEIQTEGPILNEIYAKNYKTQIINNICNFGNDLISQLSKIVDPKRKQEIESSKIEYLRHQKKNIQQLREIQGVYGVIGASINKLWNYFQRFMSIETKRLNNFLSKLKSEKQINRSTLKNFKKMIDRMIIFSLGDEELINSTNQLKSGIRKSLEQHVKRLKSKINNIKITLKLKRTLELEELKNIFEIFKEIEGFFRIKQLSQQKYLAVNISKGQGQKPLSSKMSDNQERENESKKKQLAIEENQEDYQDINIQETVTDLYESIMLKLLNPFIEITNQSKNISEKGIHAVTSNYLYMVNEFIKYKNLIIQYDIYENKDLRQRFKKLSSQGEKNIGNIFEKIKIYLDAIYESTIEKKILQKQLYMLPSYQIKEFKKLSTFFLQSKRYTFLEELLLQQGFEYHKQLTKVFQILDKSSQMIKLDFSNKKQSNIDLIDYMDSLLYLKKQVEEMKPFDQLEFQFQQKLKFSQIYKQVSEQIKYIQGRQLGSIQSLFRGETIIISEIKRMYLHLSYNGLKNFQYINLIQSYLHAYAEKLMRSISAARMDYVNGQMANLDNQSGQAYIDQFQQMFEVYEELKQIMNNKFLQKFAINEAYFTAQIEEISFEVKIKHTYEELKSKVMDYQYYTKPRQFEKIIESLKKIENIIDKLSTNTLYSHLYSLIENSEKDAQGFQGSKFTQRLKFFKAKSQDLVKSVLSEQKNQEQLIDKSNFLSLYNNLPQQEQRIIDMKLQPLLQRRIENLQNSYGKTDEQKRAIEKDLREMAGKLPYVLRKIFKNKFEDTKEKLKKKEQQQRQQQSKSTFFSQIKK